MSGREDAHGRVGLGCEAILPKTLSRYNEILIEISVQFFTKIGENSKFHVKTQKSQDGQRS